MQMRKIKWNDAEEPPAKVKAAANRSPVAFGTPVYGVSEQCASRFGCPILVMGLTFIVASKGKKMPGRLGIAPSRPA